MGAVFHFKCFEFLRKIRRSRWVFLNYNFAFTVMCHVDIVNFYSLLSYQYSIYVNHKILVYLATISRLQGKCTIQIMHLLFCFSTHSLHQCSMLLAKYSLALKEKLKLMVRRLYVPKIRKEHQKK